MAYLSLEDAKSYLGIAEGDTSEDALLDGLLLAGQAAIDARCGRSFEATTTTRAYGADAVRGQDLLLEADLLSVTTLTNGDGTVIPSSGYVLWPRNSTPYARIRLKSSYAWYFADPDAAISVAGSWGYAASAPDLVVQALREYVHFLYHDPDARRERKVGAARAGVLPQHIVDLLGGLALRW